MHTVAELIGEYVPSGHEMHADFIAKGLYDPGLQAPQVVLGKGAYDPGRQAVHADALTASVYVPSGHVAQTVPFVE